MTRNEILNWARVMTGRPAIHPSDRTLRWMLDRLDSDENRRVQTELDRLVRDAREYDLSLPFTPSVVLGGFIVSAQP